jgi:pyruvate, water dikinase
MTMIKNNSKPEIVNSGIKALDELLQGMRLGDNVVWQVDELNDYSYFSESFVSQSISDGLKCIYVRFAEHPPILKPRDGLTVIKVDPTQGFDFFSAAIHRIIEKNGERVAYVFDNLSSLVNTWATDELLANFFQLTCPYLFELNTITYFALTRNQHAPSAVARIRDTTQILLDVFHVNNQVYIHPLKVWDRYSSQMFLPHIFSGDRLLIVFSSGDAAAISASAKRPVRTISGSIAPWESVYAKLLQSQESPADVFEAGREITALRQELIRMLFGNHPKFSGLCDKYLTVDDLVKVRDRLIGSGQIGGKAAGMLVARKVLLQDGDVPDYSEVLEEHDSFFIGSDVFFTFLVNNNLFRLRLQLSRNSQISRDEFEDVERKFLSGQFPANIIEQFKDMLDYFGQAPIIVRSSSLQEDNYGNAFAGKYRSEFCANQGNPEERLEAFSQAVKLVYASALNPDALAYRKKRGLGESDEQMAILVQRVSGIPYRNYFFPALAGVAFSQNLYAWSDRIDPGKGMIRLVFGLGTRAVNRVGSDYPRMVAVSHPSLRPEVGMKIVKYSQKNVDVLDLESNEFTTRPLTEVLAHADYPNLDLIASTLIDGHIQDPVYSPLAVRPQDLVLTFNNLIKQTGLIKIMENLLAKLEKAWGQPVDIEFTTLIEKDRTIRINLLQCRPLRIPNTSGPNIKLPIQLDKKNILFQSDRSLSAGVIDNIRYIIYIDPWKYAAIRSPEAKRSLGRVVGKLNEILSDRNDSVMALGPGRWGSNNIDLGVNISYADIDNIKVLVEISQASAGHEPELSYGTHFFQDLIEAEIIYLPVFSEKPSARFNKLFFQQSSNELANLLPEFVEFGEYIRLIDVSSTCPGAYIHVIADSQTRKSICFIK